MCLIGQVPSSPSLEYAALSHRWGGSVPLILTTSLLSEFEKGIQISKLPRTFRDAVTVTRQPGLDYLWIDSLCIIQDSVKDWENESSMMSKVYSRCYVNIAATHSRNSAGGLFVDRDQKP
jgi:Heterokaryon incompatibility protein (HET)